MIEAVTVVWHWKRVAATRLKNQMYIDEVPDQIGLMLNAMIGNNSVLLYRDPIIALSLNLLSGWDAVWITLWQ